MIGWGRCRFDISSPIWALPDKARRGGGLGEGRTDGRGFKGVGQPRVCGEGVCSDQRIRFPLLAFSCLRTSRSFVNLHFYLSFYQRRSISLLLSIKQDFSLRVRFLHNLSFTLFFGNYLQCLLGRSFIGIVKKALVLWYDQLVIFWLL